jgi:hypothetical protein
MAAPEGAVDVNATDVWLLSVVAVSPVTASGAVSVSAAAADAALVPPVVTSLILIEYVAPDVRPVMEMGDAVFVVDTASKFAPPSVDTR